MRTGSQIIADGDRVNITADYKYITSMNDINPTIQEVSIELTDLYIEFENGTHIKILNKLSKTQQDLIIKSIYIE
jgi:hypothetical protein